MINSMRARYWRRRLAESLDLPPTATWYAVEHALILVRGQVADERNRRHLADRDRLEMQAFLVQAAGYWYAAGAAGEPPPEQIA